jgi:hypothetical protein
VALLTRQHINAMLAQKVTTPAAANHWLRLVKVLMQLAVEEGYRPDNPAAKSSASRTAPMDSIPGTRTRLRNSSRTTQSAARRGWRSLCCSTPRNAAPTS